MRLYGRNPVLERLKSNPQSILKIYLQQGQGDSGYIRKKAQKWGIPVFDVPGSKLMKIARNANTQGCVADVEGFAYVLYPELLEWATKKRASLVFLDGINDPQNLGATLRSLACLGDFGVVIPTHHSVEVTEAVLRVACGGDNYVKVSRVANLSRAIEDAKEAEFSIAGAVVEGGENIMEVELPFPLGLIVGSEQKGIRDVLRRHLDITLTIPMAHARLSLNVAQATTIFCYEIERQKNKVANSRRKAHHDASEEIQ
ncbi:MAG: RNA methyltransferase [Candidatus Omnitrophica bacterium]|nr:RNA methyltransferase [Candidatus Omnitrophota bacterium]